MLKHVSGFRISAFIFVPHLSISLLFCLEPYTSYLHLDYLL